MGCQLSYVFMVWKLVRSLGFLKTPKTVNISIFGNGSKVGAEANLIGLNHIFQWDSSGYTFLWDQ